MSLPVVREYPASLFVEVATGVQRDRVLESHNARLNGIRLTVSQREYEMSGDEILVIITKRSSTDEELWATREAYGCTPPSVPKAQWELRSAASVAHDNLKVVKLDEPKGK